MTTIYVSTSTQLSAALSTVKGGETIILKDGFYGDLTIRTDFPSDVVLRAENPQKASFGALRIEGSHIDLDGLSVTGRLSLIDANYISVTNSKISAWSEAIRSTNFDFSGNDFNKATLNIDNSNTFTVTNNFIHEVEGDLLRVIGNSYGGVVENNTLWDMIPLRYPDGTYIHADAIQMFSNTSGTPHDIVIRGNLIYDNPNTGDTGNLWGQGIFLGGPTGGYKNITIEQNLISIGSPNAIYVQDGLSGIKITDNTLLPWPDGSGGTIRLAGNGVGITVDGNVSGGITNSATGAQVLDNYAYSKSATATNFWGKLFGGDGDVWQDFVPKSGTAVDFGSNYGAQARLSTLLKISSPPAGSTTTDSGTTTDSTTTSPTSPTTETPTTGDQSTSLTVTGTVYAKLGATEFNGGADVIELAPSSTLALAKGTIALTFNADVVSGTHGLLSKDAFGYEGGGNHFSAYVEEGVLKVRFQDGTTDKVLSLSGIAANVDYDLQVTFGDGQVQAWVNGTSIGTAASTMAWTTNVEYMQVGALGWSSASGQPGFSNVFDGTISDVRVLGGKMTPTQLDSYLGSGTTTVDVPVVEPDPVTTVYSLVGDKEFSGKSSGILKVAHNDSLELAEGTVAFSFNADAVSKQAGLFSKDAYGYTGGGNHLSIYIKYGTLYARFQDGDSDATISVGGIKAHTDYDVAATFDGDDVSLYLNGKLVGTKDFDMDWTTNHEYMQIGGLGWSSATGSAYATNPFDGTISDVAIFDRAFTLADDFFA